MPSSTSHSPMLPFWQHLGRMAMKSRGFFEKYWVLVTDFICDDERIQLEDVYDYLGISKYYNRDEEEEIVLPLKEFMLLYKMVSNPGKTFTRQQLLLDIWGYGIEGDTHTVDVHIERLRKKFRDNTDFEIATIRGIGYKVVRK